MPAPPLEILYRDDMLVAVAKPSGLVVHRSAQAGDRVNVVTLLAAQLGCRVWPAHRLDRGASGVLLLALTQRAAGMLGRAFATAALDKRYLAVARGYCEEQVALDYPLADEDGRPPLAARTVFRRLATVELPHPIGQHATARYSLVEAAPETGRTHQIRRHLAHLRHPIVGDANHGDGRHNRLFRERFGMRRLLLHAASLDLSHPESGQRLRVEAPLPAELRALFAKLGW
jgi:tRNA pseudouridine65 synthase